MSSAKRYLSIAVAFVIVVTTFTVLTPRAVQAVTAAWVRSADNPGLQPFRATISVAASTAETYKGVDGPVVPAGKRLVIENVSIWCLNNSSDKVTGVWLTVPNSLTYALMDPATTETKTISGGTNITAYNRLVRLYYEPGETVQAQVFWDGTSGSKFVNFYLNGYFVNLQ